MDIIEQIVKQAINHREHQEEYLEVTLNAGEKLTEAIIRKQLQKGDLK